MKKLLLTLTTLLFITYSATSESPKEYYNKSCAKCHGEDGKGDTKMGKKLGAKDYTNSKVQSALTYEAAFNSLSKGLLDKDGKVLMKPYEDLTNTQIKELIEYMRTFKK